jgi:hypothetical protein
VKKLVVAFMALALSSLSFAADPGKSSVNPQQEAAAQGQKIAAQAAIHSPFATADCVFLFTSGANDTFLRYCVTENGNITLLQTPFGHEHIAVGVFGEGYGICDGSSDVAYFDYAGFGDSANWLPATVVNLTPTVVKIARTTVDGIWTLTQTITQVAGTSPSVKVAMALKNNTATARFAFLMRYADVDADGQFINSLGATANSAFAWDPTVIADIGLRGNFGVNLVADPIPPPLDPADEGPQGLNQNTPVGPPPCSPLFSVVPGLDTADDGSVVALYELNVPPNGSRTVTVHYKGM